ncbi:hypothetical protein MPH_03273 [Macrophomina phaseolina MS6]|uniref:Uncharacterized protein n=2 Tax=Macrophomina phaseolina TaxID=35725 RepID=K2SRU5_MACPH|nr:hypothetical protein MPH_03273 [Macrophomina phaseolina MS6]KAH7027133.1 hypothetical protein B0J12DRAFT_634270 [Macrophomina phaseolina]
MSSSTNNNNSTTNPGLVSSHAEYIKGAAESAIGSVTGSNAWQKSGEQDKAHAVDAMKQASANRDPANSGYGKVEEVAGRVTGCEGMEKEGAASKKQ